MLLSGGTGAAGPAIAQEQVALVGSQVRWTPEVTFNDGVESTLFEIRVTDNASAAYLTTRGALDADPVVPADAATFTNDLIRLYDDGGNGIWIFSDGGGSWTRSENTGARSIALIEGFNLVMRDGPYGTPVAEAVAGVGTALQSLFTWDPFAQAFRSFTAGLTAAFNTATTLNRGAGVWILVNRGIAWEQPAP